MKGKQNDPYQVMEEIQTIAIHIKSWEKVKAITIHIMSWHKKIETRQFISSHEGIDER
jgi:hypothetical protein